MYLAILVIQLRKTPKNLVSFLDERITTAVELLRDFNTISSQNMVHGSLLAVHQISINILQLYEYKRIRYVGICHY